MGEGGGARRKTRLEKGGARRHKRSGGIGVVSGKSKQTRLALEGKVFLAAALGKREQGEEKGRVDKGGKECPKRWNRSARAETVGAISFPIFMRKNGPSEGEKRGFERGHADGKGGRGLPS